MVSQYLHLHRIDPGWPTAHPIVKFSLVIGGLIIVVVGLWDDIQGVSPTVKITGQVVAAMFLLWDGVGVECAKPLLDPFANQQRDRELRGCRMLQRQQLDGRTRWPVRGGDGNYRGGIPFRRRSPGDGRWGRQHELGCPSRGARPRASGRGAWLYSF